MLIGSPGTRGRLREHVDHPGPRVWVQAAPLDPVVHSHAHGPDVRRGGVVAPADDRRVRRLPTGWHDDGTAVVGHSQPLEPCTDAVREVARVVAGRPDLVTRTDLLGQPVPGPVDDVAQLAAEAHAATTTAPPDRVPVCGTGSDGAVGSTPLRGGG